MIATLPMYDRPEARAAQDRFYALIHKHLDGSPEVLSRDGFHWMSPELLLSQACSLPYRAGLQDHVTIVATPVHDLACPAGTYYSAIVVRADDPRPDLVAFEGASLAINSPVSQSGWAAIDALAHEAGVTFGSIHETGSHQESATDVFEARADICAIDAVTWTMIERWDEFVPKLRVLSNSPPTPALPYITAIGRDPRPIRQALVSAVHDLERQDQEILRLVDVTHIPADHYAALPIPPAPLPT